jgi:hypothetical protein
MGFSLVFDQAIALLNTPLSRAKCRFTVAAEDTKGLERLENALKESLKKKVDD